MDLSAKIKSSIAKYKLPLLVLLLGLCLMLLPGGGKEDGKPEEPEEKMQALLGETKGVGEARVLISDHGVVVVCAGAENPQVRLDIIRAIGSYTGYGSDRIIVLKLADNS